jgi:polyhydroxyalkanoate synthase subunit PhaC
MPTLAFFLIDVARRRAGRLVDAAGSGSGEAPFRIVAKVPGARLRAYQPARDSAGPVLLILPAPIKRPYLWDLLPAVSVVRHCLRRGLRVYLLEWLDPGPAEDGFGLAYYADRLPLAALDAIAAETGEGAALLAGHSLGGTLAAVFASLHPGRVRGLALIDAPLAFGPREGGPLARAVAALPPARVLRAQVGSPVPGSFVGLLAAAAVPEAFVLQRWGDVGASLADPLALAVHTRVERWALDEFALPGQLFEDLLERLYREDRFVAGRLEVGQQRTGIARLRSPVLAVVNPSGLVVPPDSILAALAAVPELSSAVLRYEGGRGPGLQHLGPLVAPEAHTSVWPRVLDWAAAHWTA